MYDFRAIYFITFITHQLSLGLCPWGHYLPLLKYIWHVLKNTTKAERIACAAAIAAVIIFIFLVVYYSVYDKSSEEPVVDIAPHPWKISREDWQALDHHWNSTQDAFEPLKIVIIGHTAGSECYSFKECAAQIRNLQLYLMNSYNYDIQFNFLVGNDGRVYEGLGWNREGAHTFTYNNCTLGVAFMGLYAEEQDGLQSRNARVSEKQLSNTLKLFEQGVALGHLDPKFLVVGARDLSSSLAESPGENLYRAIKKWENYDHKNQFRGRTCNEIYGI